MIRLLGFLVGCSVSIGMFLLILGIPQLNLDEEIIVNEKLESVAEIIEAAKADLDTIVDEGLHDVSEFVENASDNDDSFDVQTEEAAQLTEPIDVDEAQIVALPEEPVMPALPEDADRAEPKWHAFWNPFRSRIAAEGFVGQLEKVTGLDYRIVKIRTGVYEVTFAYENDDERRLKMARIASATGLELPDS